MIAVDNLSFTYPAAQKQAIVDVSFQIEQGEIFGFLGPSGAGKSTTQKILIRLLSDYQGNAFVFDRDLKTWSAEYFERIGVSFEFPTHFLKLTAVENLTYFARLYRTHIPSIDVVLSWVGLENDGHMPVSQFSKGMKNRLSVARALLHDPEVLFLDEPTAGLDPLNARRIKDLIKAQKDAGKTVFLTTHDMMIADQLCDRIALIADGRIQVIDSPRTLKLRHGHGRVRVHYRAGDLVEQQEFPLSGLGDNLDFLKVLRTYEIQTIHSLEASLEDVFIRVTGRALQ